MTQCDLSNKKCVPCEGGVPALSKEQVAAYLGELNGWAVNADYTEISKEVTFKNYLRVMFFVNAVAYVAQTEKHHPDLLVSYNKVVVTFTTHAISGLSENDFICAAKVDALG